MRWEFHPEKLGSGRGRRGLLPEAVTVAGGPSCPDPAEGEQGRASETRVGALGRGRRWALAVLGPASSPPAAVPGPEGLSSIQRPEGIS